MSIIHLSRVLAAMMLVFGVGAAGLRASAQESTNTSGSVSVMCSYDAATESTWCSFSATNADGSAADQIEVPLSALCAPVAATGNGWWTDDGVAGPGSGFAFAIAGGAEAGGVASYSVTTAGVTTIVSGTGLVCGPASAGEGEEPAGEDGAPPADDTDDLGEAPVAAPVEDSSAPVYEEPASEGGEVVAAEVSTSDVTDASVTVVAYDCDVDPEGADPSTLAECSVAAGVVVDATADDLPVGSFVTDGSGSAVISAPVGSALVLTESQSTISNGYVPFGNGIANLTAEDGAVVVFVHLLEPQVGRLQIVNGSCPTSGEDRTEFRVIEPRSIQAASTVACTATGGTVFTISGGSLAAPLSVVTESDGSWRGFLPEGTYTVVDDSSASSEVRVVVDEISIVIVIDYLSAPLGVLNLSRQVCTDAESSSVTLTASYDEPQPGDDCELVDGQFDVEPVVEVGSATLQTVTLGPDGVEEIELEPGAYVVTDVASGANATIEIVRGSRLYVVAVETIEATGGEGDGSGTGGNGDGGDDGDGDSDGGDDGGDGGDTDGGDTDGEGDGTGGDGGVTPGDDTSGGTGNENGGGTGAEDDGGDEGGAVSSAGAGDELSSVTTLPQTGSGSGSGAPWYAFAVMSVLGALWLSLLARKAPVAVRVKRSRDERQIR